MHIAVYPVVCVYSVAAAGPGATTQGTASAHRVVQAMSCSSPGDPATQKSSGRSRRSWGNNKGGSSCAPSVADHVAFLARRSSFSGCESMTKSSRALVGSQKGKQSHPPVHLEMGFRPPSQGSLMDAFQALLGAERSSYPLGVEGGAEEAYLMCVKRDVGNL
eukprot:scaffold156693_cov22-Tisochrysis_lutea.AAC.3